jgi:Type VI secretion system, TssN
MSTTSIALKVASLVFSGGILIILFKKITMLKKYGLASVIYILLVSLLLSFPTLFNLFRLNFSEITILLCAQIFILIIGILHVVFVPATLPWYKVQPFNMQLLFIICILLLAFFFSNLSLSDLQKHQLSLVWYLSLLWFVIPVLLNKTVNELVKIPQKEYKLWYYPVDQNIDDPSDGELENPVIISFIFKKNDYSDELTTFRAKAPVGMQVGRLFYFFINDYNVRHPEGVISYTNEHHEPYGWIFKKVRNKFLGLKEVIDPDSSVYADEIRENDLLYCQRIYKDN